MMKSSFRTISQIREEFGNKYILIRKESLSLTNEETCFATPLCISDDLEELSLGLPKSMTQENLKYTIVAGNKIKED